MTDNEIKLPDIEQMISEQPVKRGRGRPKGSKGKPKIVVQELDDTPEPSESEESCSESGSECSFEEEYEYDDEPPLDDPERLKLKDELLAITERNPSVLTRPINTEASDAIDNMSMTELRARLRTAKREQSSKIDSAFTKQIIMTVNQISGRFLGILDELNESTLNDKLLLETTNDYLGSVLYEKRKRLAVLKEKLESLQKENVEL